jgi:mono/diheme cytochrome c family protein
MEEIAMNRKLTTIAAALAVAAAATAVHAAPEAPHTSLLGTKVAAAGSPEVANAARRYTGSAATGLVERGRYLARTAGCNDCHTPHYPEKAGDVPEREWLTGVPVGFQGPWGTSYPANLRLLLNDMTEAQWLARARQPMRPPMPWFALRDMTDDDLRAIYAYVRSLGPAGVPAPVAAAPGAKVDTPYFVFVPQNLPPVQAHAAK